MIIVVQSAEAGMHGTVTVAESSISDSQVAGRKKKAQLDLPGAFETS